MKSTMLRQYDLYNAERRLLLLEELGVCILFHRLATLREEYSRRLVVVVLDGVEVPCAEFSIYEYVDKGILPLGTCHMPPFPILNEVSFTVTFTLP
jgi:hypothetical protein